MCEYISIELQRSAVVLADTLRFSTAAERLGTSTEALHARIKELSARLECLLFREEGDGAELTADGRVLIDAFRAFLAQGRKLTE
jgi:DNA-binding transcriptional LysR family regulator